MSKLDAKVFSSITPFAKQWILGDELMYEFLNDYQDFLSDSYGIVDLGSLDWYAGGTTGTEKRMVANGVQNIIKKPSSAGTLANIKCLKYEVKTANGTYSKQVGISIDTAGAVIIYDENYNTEAQVADFKAAMQGVYLIFELANNIGRVNIGSLAWEYDGGGILFYKELPDKPIGVVPIFTTAYKLIPTSIQVITMHELYGDKRIGQNIANRYIYVTEDSCRSVADFKALNKNTYLYYQKQN